MAATPVALEVKQGQIYRDGQLLAAGYQTDLGKGVLQLQEVDGKIHAVRLDRRGNTTYSVPLVRDGEYSLRPDRGQKIVQEPPRGAAGIVHKLDRVGNVRRLGSGEDFSFDDYEGERWSTDGRIVYLGESRRGFVGATWAFMTRDFPLGCDLVRILMWPGCEVDTLHAALLAVPRMRY